MAMAELKPLPLPLPPPPPPSPPPPPLASSSSSSKAVPTTATIDLQPPSRRRSSRLFHCVRSVFSAFPIIMPPMNRNKVPGSSLQEGGTRTRSRIRNNVRGGGTRMMTGTLFGRRQARVSLAIQESSSSLSRWSLPMAVLELAVPTGKLLQEMGAGMVRLALECEKQASIAAAATEVAEQKKKKKKTRRRRLKRRRVLEEPAWTMYCNGRKVGHAVRREATEEDLRILKALQPVSVGAGVMTVPAANGGAGDEVTYLRAQFEQMVGSRDSETFYMMNPDANAAATAIAGPELTIFFVRI